MKDEGGKKYPPPVYPSLSMPLHAKGYSPSIWQIPSEKLSSFV
jgi:hypothetical protein